ncbi:MAG: hypothetical protein JOZ62_20450, partial [Acidobacteriaceae bacterium]|nr:hypothetical protein [Acidobacteriaceae bacterium]
MRPRASVVGPLILIGIGLLFLIHTLAPEFHIFDLFAQYWPYFLILWGAAQLLEIFVRAARGAPISPAYVSGGLWFIVLLFCILGMISFHIHHASPWWEHLNWQRGVQFMGEEHDYAIDPIRKPLLKAPHIVIENFAGDARIAGADASDLVVNGRKAIRAIDPGDADRVNKQTPVQVLVQGDRVLIRCNQDKAGMRTPIATNLDLSVPKDASIEANGRHGEFDISSISGNCILRTEH